MKNTRASINAIRKDRVKWLSFGAPLLLAMLIGNIAAGAADLPADGSPKNANAWIPDTTANSAASAAALDKTFGVKMWDFQYPSFADTWLQDAGGWRTTLASYGFGFEIISITSALQNVLNAPRSVPSAYGPCHPPASGNGSICAGSQAFLGEGLASQTVNQMYLTYDLGRWGIPDGQIQVEGTYVATNVNPSYVRGFSLEELAYYQTAFDKKLEVKVGYLDTGSYFVGLFIGGNFSNTFGVTAAVPVEMGETIAPTGQPAGIATWHFDDHIYTTAGVYRSTPFVGPSANPIYNAVIENPTGIKFTLPNAGFVAENEVGYKTEAAPGVKQTWLRIGNIYNSSPFNNLSGVTPVSGGDSVYVLGDRQLWQVAPGQASTAYRGLYAGASFMYAPPDIAAFSQYYEARLYTFGLFDSRPQDMISLVYSHNEMSRSLTGAINSAFAKFNGIDPTTGFNLPQAFDSANSIALSYLAHIRPGMWAQVGLQYTDHPSLEYFKGEGQGLTASITLVNVF
jgi:porin